MTQSDSSMARFLQHAIAINNKAVGLMADGQSDTSILCFQAALQAMKEASNSSTASDLIEKAPFSLVSESTVQILKPCINALLPKIREHGYVYSHHFLLEQSSLNVDNETLLALYSATVLFNFGLALHKHGLLSGSEDAIRKALFVYDLAHALLRPCAMECGCEPFMVVIAVVFNNQAQIYLTLCEFENAKRQLLNLGTVLQSKYWQLCRTLPDSVVDELHLNYLVCHIPYASHAA